MRKEFLLEEDKKSSGKLLDPAFKLQPEPSLDLMFFHPPSAFLKDYSTYVKKRYLNRQVNNIIQEISSETEYPQIADEFQDDTQSKMPDDYFNTGKQHDSNESYRSTTRALELSNTITNAYTKVKSKTLQFLAFDPEPEFFVESDTAGMLIAFQGIYSDKTTNGISKKRTSVYTKLNAFLDSDFLNANLSVGGVVIKESSQELLNFIGNTAYGSSGGLIVDKSLRILGVNFGYFNDSVEESSGNSYYKEQFRFASDSDLFMFDVQVDEDSDNRNIVKNRNIAVNIKHHLVQKFRELYLQQLNAKLSQSKNGKNAEKKRVSFGELEIGFKTYQQISKSSEKRNDANSKADDGAQKSSDKNLTKNSSKVHDISNQDEQQNSRKLNRIKKIKDSNFSPRNKSKDSELTFEGLQALREKYGVAGNGKKKIKY